MYKVTPGDTYHGFTSQRSSISIIEITVDSDLGVGPFYVHHRDDYLKAKSEIRRYLRENWGRNDDNVRYRKLQKTTLLP